MQCLLYDDHNTFNYFYLQEFYNNENILVNSCLSHVHMRIIFGDCHVCLYSCNICIQLWSSWGQTSGFLPVSSSVSFGVWVSSSSCCWPTFCPTGITCRSLCPASTCSSSPTTGGLYRVIKIGCNIQILIMQF